MAGTPVALVAHRAAEVLFRHSNRLGHRSSASKGPYS
jgi:hypothetical protein